MKIGKAYWFIIIVALIYLTLVISMFLVERNAEGSNINTIGDAFWYSLVTMTTVGYGDKYPQSGLGKVVGLFFLLGSLSIFGVLVGAITERFTELNENRKMGYTGTDFTHHVIIIGWNNFGRSVVKQLLPANRKVAIMTNNKDDIELIYEDLGKKSVFVMFSDLQNVNSLEKMNVKESSMIFVNLDSDTDKLISILNIRDKNPDAKFLVILNKPDLKDTFSNAGVSYVISKNEIAAKLIASYIFEPDVADMANDLMGAAENQDDYDIQQYQITATNPYLNKTYGEVFLDLKSRFNVIAIGMVKVDGNKRQLIKVPEDSLTLNLGDYIILICNGNTQQLIQDLFKTEEGIA
ncbi:MAG: potassium channel family protein [Bacteroidota bacterium]